MRAILLLVAASIVLNLNAATSLYESLSLRGDSRQAFARYEIGLLGAFKNADGTSLELDEEADGSVVGTLVLDGATSSVIAHVRDDVLVGLAGGHPGFRAEFVNGALEVDLGDALFALHRVYKVEPSIADLGEVQPDPDRLWTIAIYLAGDNDLELSAMLDMQEIVGVLPLPGVEVVVFLDRAPGHLEEEGAWSDACR
jgi:hypothetical protein